MEKESDYLQEWEKIKNINKKFELRWADWFYLPDNLWNSSQFWEYLIDVFPRLRPGIAVSDDSLTINYYKDLDPIRDRKHECKTVKVTFKFHYYRCIKNYNKILELHKKFPKWKCPKRDLKRIKQLNTE
jgi:hypothetical protein